MKRRSLRLWQPRAFAAPWGDQGGTWADLWRLGIRLPHLPRPCRLCL